MDTFICRPKIKKNNYLNFKGTLLVTSINKSSLASYCQEKKELFIQLHLFRWASKIIIWYYQRRISYVQLGEIFSEISTISKGGFNMQQAIAIVLKTANNKAIKWLLQSILIMMHCGFSITQSMSFFSNCFDPHLITIASTVDTNNDHINAFQIMSQHCKTWADFHYKITKAMFYPLVLLIMSIICLLTWYNMQISTKNLTTNYQFMLFIELATLIIVVTALLKFIYWLMYEKDSYLPVLTQLIFRIPVLGNIITVYFSFLLFNQLLFLSKSHIKNPIMILENNFSHFSLLQPIISNLFINFEKGKDLSQQILLSKYIDSTAGQMFALSNNTKNLIEILENINKMLESKLERSLNNIIQKLPIITIIAVAILIVVCIIRFLLPFYDQMLMI